MRKIIPILLLTLACKPVERKKTYNSNAAVSNTEQNFNTIPRPEFSDNNSVPKNFLSCNILEPQDGSTGIYLTECNISMQYKIQDLQFTVKRNDKPRAESIERKIDSMTPSSSSKWRFSIPLDLEDTKIEVIAKSQSFGISDSVIFEKEKLDTHKQVFQAKVFNLEKGRLITKNQDNDEERCIRFNDDEELVLGECETRELDMGGELNDLRAFELSPGIWVLQTSQNLVDDDFNASCLTIVNPSGVILGLGVHLLGCPAMNSETFENFSASDFPTTRIYLDELDESGNLSSSFVIRGSGVDYENLCVVETEDGEIEEGNCGNAMKFNLYKDRIFKRKSI